MRSTWSRSAAIITIPSKEQRCHQCVCVRPSERCAVEAHVLGCRGAALEMGLPGVGRGSSSARTAAPRHCWLCHVHHAMNANFPGSSRRESASKGQCDAQRGLPPVTAMIAELIATIEMPATRPAKRAMRWSFAVYARAELMKVLPEPGSIDPVRAQPVVRSARVRGGCPAHGGRVRPAACSFCINLRPAWSPTIQYA